MLPIAQALEDYFRVISSSLLSPSISKQNLIVSEVLAALETDQLELPVLPDMAFKVRSLLDDPDSSTGQFVQLISTDLAITLYIMKAANIAAFSNGQRVGNLHDAILHLGYQMLYSMVLNITLAKLFQARSPLINQKLQDLWKRSRTVAANSYVVAQKKKHLKPEDAMLAGLIHEIGALPLYLYADRHYPEVDEATLESLIATFSAPVSLKMLQIWNFTDELIDVVADRIALRRTVQSDKANYVDVVTMANLQTQETSKPVEWRNVFAAERLGCYPGDCKNLFSNHAEQFAAAKGMLGMSMA
jgi:HD-like signal output (HDOD) protein